MKQREFEDRKQLNEFILPESRKGSKAEAIHKVGMSFVEIIKTAKEKEMDLIVMATH